MLIFFFWMVFSVLVAVYASKKGLNGAGFFFLSLFLSPLLGFLIAAAATSDRHSVARRQGLKKCPACAEYVQPEASVCRYCHSNLAPVAATPTLCPSCGKYSIPPGAKFCTSCGVQIAAPKQVEATKVSAEKHVVERQASKKQPVKQNMIFAFGAFLVLAVLISLVYLSSLTEDQPRQHATSTAQPTRNQPAFCGYPDLLKDAAKAQGVSVEALRKQCIDSGWRPSKDALWVFCSDPDILKEAAKDQGIPVAVMQKQCLNSGWPPSEKVTPQPSLGWGPSKDALWAFCSDPDLLKEAAKSQGIPVVMMQKQCLDSGYWLPDGR